jgi:trypsin-like peptidase
MRTTPKSSALRALVRGRLLALAALSGMCLIPHHATAGAAKIDRSVKQAILDCTFEVLAQSPATTSDTRAFNPSPLVRVAGSAFCYGDGELATAAHVFEPVLGGRFEVPFVRDRKGRTYKVESVTRYSLGNDFVTFKVAGLPPRAARPHSTSSEPSKALYVAWREGDGEIAFGSTEFRGRTTLAAFGRDGWIQFGPAPGHGASGAALFDDPGRVVGLINNRSSEGADALGYAVPIEMIDAASTQWADVSLHDPMRILGMPSERNQPLIGGIPLPAPYARFDKHMTDVRRTYYAHMLPYSLSLGGLGAPLSDNQRASLCAALGPEYCVDGALATSAPVSATRYGRGCDVVWNGVGAALVRCIARDAVAASRMMDDDRTQAATLSVGQQFVQAPPAPCTSEDGLDPAVTVDLFTDHTGAQWQVRASPARGCDWIVISMSRPVADGMQTLVRGAPSAYVEAAVMQLKVLTAIQRDGDKDGNGEIKDAVVAELRGATPLAR